MLGRIAVVVEGVAVGIGAAELVGKARPWQEARESFRGELTVARAKVMHLHEVVVRAVGGPRCAAAGVGGLLR
eukprot:14912820-Alexandrium_andersonii.AAC.1